MQLEGARQDSLVITDIDQPIITVDNLKVAQFIYLLLNNQEIRNVIDAIAKKFVLILGRFAPERKVILDALKDELRKLDYLPVLFDFEKPASRDFTETLSTLAHMSRFVIADLTEAGSVPYELQSIIPHLRIPVQPLLLASEEKAYSMFSEFRRYPWVLPTCQYKNTADLLATLKENVIEPAEVKAKELQKIKERNL